MNSYFLGFIGVSLQLILILSIKSYLHLEREKPNLKDQFIWTIVGLIGTLFLFFLLKVFLPIDENKSSLYNAIFFILGVTPLLEEFLYRRVILQHFLNLKEQSFSIKELLALIWMSISLIIPPTFLGQYTLKHILYTFVAFLLPFCYFSFKKSERKKPFINCLSNLIFLISQDVLFVLGHGSSASMSLFFTGFLYGFLYLESKTIIPSLIAHYFYNFLIFIYS